jgi:hypothetical protein
MSNLKVNTINDASGGSNAVLYGVAAPANSMGFRNRLINGSMVVAQRGASVSVGGSETYTLDRWAGIAAGANFTVSQGALPARYVLVATGASGNTLADISQRIEALNSIDLASTPCTVSLDLYSSDGRSVAWEVYSANSANVFAAKTLISSGTLTTTAGSYVPKTFQFTATAAASNGLELRFKFGALGSGAQCALSNVQLEAGSVASPFERRDYGRELMMCQRYYWQSETVASGSLLFDITGSLAGQQLISATVASLPVTMRATPTVAVPAGSFTNGSGGFTAFGQRIYPSGGFSAGGRSFYQTSASGVVSASIEL